MGVLERSQRKLNGEYLGEESLSRYHNDIPLSFISGIAQGTADRFGTANLSCSSNYQLLPAGQNCFIWVEHDLVCTSWSR
jgi:hypothetical protein